MQIKKIFYLSRKKAKNFIPLYDFLYFLHLENFMFSIRKGVLQNFLKTRHIIAREFTRPLFPAKRPPFNPVTPSYKHHPNTLIYHIPNFSILPSHIPPCTPSVRQNSAQKISPPICHGSPS